MTQPTNIEDILVLSKDAWDMSYDLEASQKKLDEIVTSTYLQTVWEMGAWIEETESVGV